MEDDESEEEEGPRISEARLLELRQIFDSFDKDKSGKLDKYEIAGALQIAGHDTTPSELQEMLDSVDLNGDGLIDFEEFISLMEAPLPSSHSYDDEIKEAFLFFDSDGDGFVTMEDFSYVMKSLEVNITDADIEKLFHDFDEDGDMKLNYLEFAAVMH